MENGPKPTPEQEARRKKANELFEAIERGEITSMDGIKPNETSIEVALTARKRLVELGHIARTKFETEL